VSTKINLLFLNLVLGSFLVGGCSNINFTSSVGSSSGNSDSYSETPSISSSMPTTSEIDSSSTSESSSQVDSSPSSSVTTSSSSIDSSASSSSVISYLVTFVNYDDSVLYSLEVEGGQDATYAGDTPSKPSTTEYNFTFSGWDKDLTNVSNSFTTKAEFTTDINTYTVVWENFDGTILQTSNISFGTMPIYEGENPLKLDSEGENLSFVGWSPEVTTVSSNVTYTAQFAETIEYILVSTATELSNIKNDLSKNYLLTNNIDLNNEEWTPIGSISKPFTGIFDGKGYTISNLKISKPQIHFGLFAFNDGVIKNLKLANIQFSLAKPLISDNLYAGSLVAYSTGKIKNVETLSGLIQKESGAGNQEYVGGVIGGLDNIDINSVTNRVNISLSSSIATGGIVGFLKNGDRNLINLINYGKIDGGSSFGISVGGLIGKTEASTTISDSINMGEVIGGNKTGGLVGDNFRKLSIINSVNHGNIFSGISTAGGLVGDAGRFIDINKSENLGNIIGYSYVGGLIGIGFRVNVFNSMNKGKINFNLISGFQRYSSFVGGLVGGINSDTTISNSMNLESVFGYEKVGGLIGGSTVDVVLNISNSISIGNITARDTIDLIGGIIGTVNIQNNFSNVYFFGTITGKNTEIMTNVYGTKIEDLSFLSNEFFINTLEWDIDIWNFEGLDVANGIYPTLKA